MPSQKLAVTYNLAIVKAKNSNSGSAPAGRYYLAWFKDLVTDRPCRPPETCYITGSKLQQGDFMLQPGDTLSVHENKIEIKRNDTVLLQFKHVGDMESLVMFIRTFIESTI